MKNSLRIISILFFVVGVLLGILVTAGTVYVNIESTAYFGPNFPADESLKTLSCPTIMDNRETGFVTVSLKNDTNREIDPLIIVEISNPGVFRTSRENLKVMPGETGEIRWEVTSEDEVFDHLILVRVYQSRSYRTPSRTETCGILMLDLNRFNGETVLLFGYIVSFVSLILGIGLWTIANHPMRENRGWRPFCAMVAVAVSLSLGMLVGYFNIWVLGILFLIVTLIMIIETVRQFILST